MCGPSNCFLMVYYKNYSLLHIDLYPTLLLGCLYKLFEKKALKIENNLYTCKFVFPSTPKFFFSIMIIYDFFKKSVSM